MKLKAELAVALAAQVNTALMTQPWLIRNNILTEADLPNTVMGPGLIQATTPNFELLALADRIQFAAVDPEEKSGDSGEVVFATFEKLIRILPHTPVTGLGINFVWLIPLSDRASRELFAPQKSFFGRWFTTDDSRFGGYASCAFKGLLRLKLTVRPITLFADKSEHLEAAFNFHADVKSSEELLENLAFWRDAREYAKKIATDLNDRVALCSKS